MAGFDSVSGQNLTLFWFFRKTQSSTFADNLAVLNSEHLGGNEDIFDLFEKFGTQIDIVPRHEGDGQMIVTGGV